MPHYRLVASGRRPELNAEEIILERHENGEPQHSLSTSTHSEIPDELLAKARNLAYQLGFNVAEVEPPEDSEESNSEGQQQQPAAPDTASQAPAVSPTGESGAEIDQQQTAQQTASATQQNAPSADAATTQSGTPASSATTQGGVAGSSAISTT